MDVEIRAPRQTELPDLVALLVMQLREHDNDLSESMVAHAAEGMMRRPQRGRFVVALEAGRMVGFAALAFQWTLERGGRAAWLDELDPNALAPDSHIWTSSQVAWLRFDDDLPRHAEHGPDS